MRNTILVTGAAGFVGGHLISQLTQEAGETRLVAWRRPRSTKAHPYHPPRPHRDRAVTWQEVNLLDPTAVSDAVASCQPTQVYHCAGVANVGDSWANGYETLRSNVLGTEHLLKALHTLDTTTRVLIPGSALVYGPSTTAITETDPLGPVSPYGLSKLAQELLGQAAVEQDGMDVILTRSFTHVGPGQTPSYAAASFAQQIANIERGRASPVLSVGNLDARRDLTDVRDTVRAYLTLMACGQPGRPYNVCTGTAYRIDDVLSGLLSMTAVDVAVRPDPQRSRPSDNPLLLGDRTRITKETGWAPKLGLDQTLADLLNYWRRMV
ncbi:MAG: GDP-mannose 4,6-dehydratase [Acidobacteriota bacterium]|nr:GDP-mannose 4,6-dehydratase [Acidobacteriota bacterium]